MSNQEVLIRNAESSDLQTIVGYNRAMALETEDKHLDDATSLAGVQAALGDSNRCSYFLAELGGTVVGQTMITFEWSDWRNRWFWWLQSVYVEPNARRHGVFSALYKHIRTLAKKQADVCGIRLYVFHTNDQAQQTYRKLGMSHGEYVLCEEDFSSDSI